MSLPTWGEIAAWISGVYMMLELRYSAYAFFATVGVTQVLKAFIPADRDPLYQIRTARALALLVGISATVLLIPSREGIVLGVINGTLSSWVWSRVVRILYHRYPWLETKLSNTPGYDPNEPTD